MAAHGNPIALRINGKYRRIDPSTFDGSMNVAVRVGLGSGRKEQRLLYRGQLASLQQQGLQLGLADPKKIYNNVAAMVRDSNLGSPDDYWVNPDSDDFKPPQPGQDPAAAKAAMDAQIAQQRLQMDAQAQQQTQALAEQRAQAELQHKQQMAALQLENERAMAEQKAQLARDQAEAQAQLAREKADFEARLAEQQADRDFILAERRAEREHELARERFAGDHAVAMHKASNPLPNNRPGGDLSK